MQPNEKLDMLLDEQSPSVQTHLSIMQGVIQRMASNSASSKTWCVTLVSAILVMVADKEKTEYALIALLPIIIFAALDSYYLTLEKSFRNSYNEFIDKLHYRSLETKDLYAIYPKGDILKLQLDSLKSFSIWGFYIPLFVLVLIVKSIVVN